MATLIAFPILGLAVIAQTAIVSRITLLQGTADVVLLIVVSWILQARVDNHWQWALIAGFLVGSISALPIWVFPMAYLLVTGAGILLKSRVWQIPVLAVFAVALLGTLIIHTLTFIVLSIEGIPLDLREVFNLITLPSLLLNLLLTIPLNGLISEVARWVYPVEIEV